MSKQIIIAEEHRVAAVVSEDQIEELIVATGTHQVSDIYLGTVENVLPSIDAAFVNIGDADRNGFIHVSDLGPLRLRKTAGSITELLAPQQKVLVQVMKEPTGNKGPRLTGNISLPGRYVVLMPYGRGVNLSRRIKSENERNRLRALAILTKPAGMGILVRTEAENVPEEAIIEDLEALQKSWETTTEEALATRAPALLTRDDDFIQKVLRDAYSHDVNRIVTDSAMGIKRVKQHLTGWGGGRMPQGVLVDHHRERTSILEYFRVNAAIREALKPRVDLPSGGYIVIEKTEALTVIDVNSGSFTRSQTSRETVLWTNCESATEIARQLRLRNIAGVIIVDFIDMDSRRDQLQVLEHFNRAMQLDKAKPQIAQLTELGLVELTRKRQGKNIYELFGQSCTTCSGLGLVARLPGEAAFQSVQPGNDRISESRESRESRRPEPRRDAVGRETVSRDAEYGEEATGEAEELELMHHPSYQERGGRAGRGARGAGRRRRGELPLPKEGVTARMSPWEEEARYAASGRSGTGATGATNLIETPTPAFTPPFIPAEILPEAIERSPERGDRPERGERGERPERGERRERGRGRRDRFPAEPPEFVHVEMTADEQEVYSWMGISPLVLTTQEVKNPRNIYIAVTLPGEAPPTPPMITATLEETAADIDEEQFDAPEPLDNSSISGSSLPASNTFEPEPAADEPPSRRLIRRRERQDEPVEPTVTKLPEVGSSKVSDLPSIKPFVREQLEIALPAATEDEPDDDESSGPVVRRRRRRSSAT
jgi:ribonuclease E